MLIRYKQYRVAFSRSCLSRTRFVLMPVPALRRRDDSLAYLSSSSSSSSMLSLSSCNHHDHDYFQYILILMTRKMVRIDHANLNLIIALFQQSLTENGGVDQAGCRRTYSELSNSRNQNHICKIMKFACDCI